MSTPRNPPEKKFESQPRQRQLSLFCPNRWRKLKSASLLFGNHDRRRFQSVSLVLLAFAAHGSIIVAASGLLGLGNCTSREAQKIWMSFFFAVHSHLPRVRRLLCQRHQKTNCFTPNRLSLFCHFITEPNSSVFGIGGCLPPGTKFGPRRVTPRLYCMKPLKVGLREGGVHAKENSKIEHQNHWRPTTIRV